MALKKSFDHEQIEAAHKDMDKWFHHIVNDCGFGKIIIDINVEAQQIEIKPTPYYRHKRTET